MHSIAKDGERDADRKGSSMSDDQEHGSEVARLLTQISQEYESAWQGLTGLSQGSSRHTFITAKMEKMGQLQDRLETIVGKQSAAAMICEQLEASPETKRSAVQEPERMALE